MSSAEYWRGSETSYFKGIRAAASVTEPERWAPSRWLARYTAPYAAPLDALDRG